LALDKFHEEKILEAIRKADESIEYGEVRVKIDKSASRREIIIETQEKIRYDKKA